MPVTAVHRLAEESPTRALARVATRNTMLNTISDRVQLSQEQHQIPGHRQAPQNYQIAASESQESQFCGTTKNKETVSPEEITRPSSYQKYDITTLIELRKSVQDSSEVLLKVKPEAIAENIFQYMGISHSLRPSARSRGLSNISSLSHRSMISSNEMDEWEPSRQPRPAPRASDIQQTSRLQQHEGFVRFLKQHASPPHQRVTAGGRIVPTGPLSPPPMFDYASLNGLVQGQQGKTQAPARGRTNPSLNSTANTLPASSQPSYAANFLANQSSQSLGSQMMSSGIAQGTVNDGSLPFTPQPFMSPMVQSPLTQFALMPLGLFPDGTALISCNGICYHSYWNGITTIMEPITTGQTIPMTNDTTTNFPPTPLGDSFYGVEPIGTIAPSTSNQSVSLPSSQSSTMPNFHQSQPTDPTRKSTLLSEENILKAQLTNLDKHLALHHYEIGPAERTQLVSQRKTLVQVIAKLRNDREPIKQMIPIVGTCQDASCKSSTHPDIITRPILATQQPEQDASRDASLNENTFFKKCLSPSAPAFVPSGGLKFFSDNLKLGLTPKKSAAVTLKKPLTASSKTSGNSMDDTVADQKPLWETSSSSQSQPYVEADPWDPAMKIVPPSMIDYAQKYNTDSTGANKKFCTTVAEFQEAIRRVREQARMWGCVGGNSKDPAYDAEEDIWYAIKDEYPIPLPTEVPDHITCPRPWNWYDSAFNVKATIEPRINMRGDTFEDVYPQPKTDATSTKYTFADILPPTKKERENVKDTHGPSVANPTPDDLDHLPQEDTPFRMHIRDTLLNQHQDHQQASGEPLAGTKGDFSGRVDSLRAPSINKLDTAMHPPLSAGYSQAGVQKKHEPFASQARGQPNSLPSAHQHATRVKDQVRQGHRTINMSQGLPSPTAISAAQVAYGSRVLTSSRLLKGQVESISERPLTTRNLPHAVTSVGKPSIQGSTTPSDLSRNQIYNVSAADGLQRNALQTSASPTAVNNQCDAQKKHTKLDTFDSTEVAGGTNKGDTPMHGNDCACSYCQSYEWGDERVHSPRAGRPKLQSEMVGVLSAESKGMWGPEQLCAAVEEHNVPKVKIPGPMTDYELTYGRDHSNNLHGDRRFEGITSNTQVPSAHEVKLENVSGIPSINSDTFLKDMLRNPRYSFTFQRKDGTPMEPLMSSQMAQDEHGRKFMEKMMQCKQHGYQAMEKENTKSAHGSLWKNTGDASVLENDTAIVQGSGFRLFQNTRNSPSLATNKASSSLASSAYQAQGYLPPYDGAGKARAASIYQQQPNRAQYKKPHIHLPLSSSYAQHDHSDGKSVQRSSIDQASYNANACYIPATFGYDGSGDPPADDDTAGRKGKAKAQGNSSFEYKGVTTSDFDQHRPDHDNEWHRGNVNDFFRDLHEKEVRNMMARQRKNTKTAP